MEYLYFILALIVIVKMSDIFLDKAIYISCCLKISKVVIGATVVSFCTVLPETVISISAALNNDTSMSFGNAIGSVICNTALILGTGIVISKPKLKSTGILIKNSIFVVVLGIIILISLHRFHQISFAFGLLLFIITILSILQNTKSQNSIKTIISHKGNFIKNLICLVLSALIIGLCSKTLVVNGQKIAEHLGVPNVIIGLILTAIGSSIPEMVTLISSIKKDAFEISLGNIIGANILNMGFITGVSSVIRPLSVNLVSGAFYVLAAMAFTVYLVLCFLRKNKTLYRSDGLFLILSYIFFLYLSVAYT